jgi:hypothetical protein
MDDDRRRRRDVLGVFAALRRPREVRSVFLILPAEDALPRDSDQRSTQRLRPPVG